LKPLAECSEKEKKQHNIIEKNGSIFVEITEEEENIKILSECTQEEKSDHGITESDGIIYVKLKN
jgi:hypothetical protein